MKSIITSICVALVSVAALKAQNPVEVNIPTKEWAIQNQEDYRKAGHDAIKRLLADMMDVEELGVKSFAIFPIINDAPGNYLTQLARNEFVEQGRVAGYKLISRSDAVTKKLLSEIALGQRNGQNMDPASIQKFGKMNGAESVLLGRVNAAEEVPGLVRVRVNLQAFNVETSQMIWGKEIEGSVKIPIFIPKKAPEKEKKFVEVPDTIVELPGDAKQRFWWMVGIAGAVVALLLFFIFMMSMKSRKRPR